VFSQCIIPVHLVEEEKHSHNDIYDSTFTTPFAVKEIETDFPAACVDVWMEKIITFTHYLRWAVRIIFWKYYFEVPGASFPKTVIGLDHKPNARFGF